MRLLPILLAWCSRAAPQFDQLGAGDQGAGDAGRRGCGSSTPAITKPRRRPWPAALELGSGDKDRAEAHKHLAFIHCTAGRERQCREEFRKALAADPRMRLDAGGSRASGVGADLPLAERAGRAQRRAQAVRGGRTTRNRRRTCRARSSSACADKERANAHKHLAFIHCASNREQQCRDEFRKALAVDPALELAPEEAGHPVWGPIFRVAEDGQVIR